MSTQAENKFLLLHEYGRRFSDVTLLFHELVAQRAGLAPADHKYLGVLLQKGAMPAGELSRLTGLTTGAITGVIDRLEKKGLVARRSDEADRRKVLIVPDEQRSMALLGQDFQRLQEKLAALYGQFSDEELQIVTRFIVDGTTMMEHLVEEFKQEKGD